jgi:hypothetical protein
VVTVAVRREIPLPRAIDRHLARQLFAEIAAHPDHQPTKHDDDVGHLFGGLGMVSSAIGARNSSAIPSFALAATRALDDAGPKVWSAHALMLS